MQACCAGTDAATEAGDGAGGCWLEQAANPLVHFLCMANSPFSTVAGSRHDPSAK
jgi:hypothetical protein